MVDIVLLGVNQLACCALVGGGSMPYFSYMCLVDRVEDGKVMFDPAVGCDQGGPTPTQPGKAWDWYIENVKEECDSPGTVHISLSNNISLNCGCSRGILLRCGGKCALLHVQRH